jgi:diguanylate cyclase (GGDEF)-like protein/PAS domain S-box-containing protein
MKTSTTEALPVPVEQADDPIPDLLGDAVASVTIGFTIYNPQDRLVMCNEAYLGMYETSRDLIVPGATFEEVVRKGAERGQYRQALGDVDGFVRERVKRHQNPTGKPFEQALDDGRWLLIVEHKTASGYLVGNRLDITAQKQAEHGLHLYANVFRHSGEALMVTDRHNCIVAINPAFARLTGYELPEIEGQNPRILSSGRTPMETYQQMWANLQSTDFWQGELWDRRKDGSVYPKWVVISVIRDESGELTHHIASFTDISERKAAEERISHLAHHDALTGLFNRYSLQERLGQVVATAHRHHMPVAVMFIDMDRFKLINDMLGHDVGDQLLIEIAKRLRGSVRESDIVARLGGDEFVVVLAGMEAAFDVYPVASKILQRLGEPYGIADHTLHTSPSIGVSVFPGDGDTVEQLMKNVDAAMHHAKEQGRNNIQFFTMDMNLAALERLELERDLRTAIASGGLELHYQVQVCSLTLQACGVEALVRWPHPTRGMIPPLTFIPIAEECRLIDALGAWVLDEGCRQLAAWQATGLGDMRMAINVSAQQLRSEQFVDQVRSTIAVHGIRPQDLELEITESVAMSDPQAAIRQLQALRDLGVQLAIDDFGTGYSSLAYLRQLPLTVLKIDRLFVKDIEVDGNNAAISGSILALAHSLGLKVVAEGVETSAQRDFLRKRSCEYLQGFYFARPQAAARCREIIESLSLPRPV